MKIQAFYLTGEVQEFDTQSMFNAGGLCLNRAGLVFFSLEYTNPEVGMWLRYRYFNIESATVTDDEYPAPRPTLHSKYQLLDLNDIKNIAWVELDGKKIITRVGNSLVNNIKFDSYSTLLSTSEPGTPFNVQACETFMGLVGNESRDGLLPRKPNESEYEYHCRVADSMGWNYDTLAPFLEAFDNARGSNSENDEDDTDDLIDSD